MPGQILSAHIAARNTEVTTTHEGGFNGYYLDVLQERADMYGAHIATMAISPEIVYWAMAMTTKHASSYVRAHHFIADWVTGLLIAIYGEEPRAEHTVDGLCWPNAFLARDLEFAQKWLTGAAMPEGFRYLTPNAE